MKKVFLICIIILALNTLTAFTSLSAVKNFKSDYIGIKNIDKLAYVDLNGDGIKEALLEAEGSIIKFDEDVVFLNDGYLAEPKEEALNADYDYNKVLGIFYKSKNEWIPLLLGAYDGEVDSEVLLFTAVEFLKNGKKQVILNFSHSGSAMGIDYYLFQYQGNKLDLLFHTWHDKYGGETRYNIFHGSITDKRALYTPFQTPTHYYTSLWAYKVLYWKQDKFEIIDEWMEWNKGGNGFTLDPDMGCGDSARIIFKTQERFKNGKEQWRAEPLEVVRRYHPEFSDVKIIFNKNGLAIVKLRGEVDNKQCEARSYLYQPFYEVDDKSIWEEAYYGRSGMMGIVPASALSEK